MAYHYLIPMNILEEKGFNKRWRNVEAKPGKDSPEKLATLDTQDT